MAYLTIRGRKLHYEDHGAGPPVLFGTSYLWDASMWTPQIEHLKTRYRCIVPEIWGHGGSDGVPEVPCSLAALAADIGALVDHLKIERFAIVGLSVGGMWGARLALDWPARVKGLALFDTFVGPEPAVTQARYFGMLDTIERLGLLPPPLVEQVLPLFFSPATLAEKPALVDRFRQSLLTIAGDRVATIVALGRAIFSRESLLERLPQLVCPTLVAVGRDDRSRPVHEAEAMAKLIPGATLEIVDRAGHVSNVEQPERVNAMLTDFLASVDRA